MSQAPDPTQPPSGWGAQPGSAQPGSTQPGSYPPPPAGGRWGTSSPVPSGAAGNLFHDPASGLMLPQGTELASVGRRIGAYFLAIPLSIVTLGIGYLIWGLVVWGRGQTPALQVLGMRCYRPDTGQVAGWGRMALREIIGRVIDGILSIITGIISFVLFCTRGDRRSLHDLVAGTVVLHDPNKVLATK